MSSYSWFVSAVKKLKQVLDESDHIDGYDFLVAYLRDVQPEELPAPGSEFADEEIETFAKDHLDEFEIWLKKSNLDWLAILDRHTWRLASSVQTVAREERTAREKELGSALDIIKAPIVPVKYFTILDDQLSRLVEAGRSERFFSGLALFSLSMVFTSAINYLTASTETQETLKILVAFFSAAFFVSVLIWFRSAIDIPSIEAKVRAIEVKRKNPWMYAFFASIMIVIVLLGLVIFGFIDANTIGIFEALDNENHKVIEKGGMETST